MKVRHLLARIPVALCVSAILLNCFNIGLAQKPQTRYQKLLTENLLKRVGASAQRALSFEENQGQAQAQTRFLVRGNQFAASLSTTEATFSLGNARCACTQNLVLQFVGANNQAQPIGEQLLKERSNYLIGNDPKAFRTNIPHYAQARFNQVYSGVDVLYYGDAGHLKYDIVVAPNTDPNVIKIRYAGTEGIEIDRAGNLLLKLNGGKIIQPKPLIYQSLNGKRHYVAGRYVVENQDQIAFRIGNYDASIPLVIDPVLVFSTYLGGSGSEEGTAVTTDFEGNAYVVGATNSLNFPLTPGVFQSASGGGKDLFVTKLNPNGNGVVYSTYIGGSLDDYGYGIAIDTGGNVYLTGTTASANYPVTPGVTQSAKGGGTDAFISKLNPTGSALLYSTYLGGAGNEEGFGIALDTISDVVVTGVTASNNYLVTVDALQSTLSGPTDAFVTRLDPARNLTVFSTYLGGSGTDMGFAITLDASSNSPIVTGLTDSMNFPTTAGAFRTVSAGGSDAFVVKLDRFGTESKYATYLGGSGIDAGLGIAVDANGNVYVNGLTDSSNFPTTPGSVQPTNAGGESDAFVTKLNATGASLVYSTYLGGNGADSSASIAVGFGGKTILSGTTTSANFPVTGDALQAALSGSRDAFLSRLNPDGSAQSYSSFIGGGQNEEAFGVATDVGANTYVTGTSSSSNFPTTTGAFQSVGPGGTNGFLVKVGPGSDSPIQLLTDSAGSVMNQAAGLESVLLTKDPFDLASTVVHFSPDQITRVTIFVANLQLLPGETPSDVVVNLVDANNQSHDLAAEGVRQVPYAPFTQVTFKLPGSVGTGACTIKVKAHGQFTNIGTIRTKN
ncbi:MAG TPA: SBBP repeat-containing protein [Pyrinomonadaceae bacterium]|nr:SBBP repeat-containing protein [Pyrinomonadaceae bacterium]